MMTRSAWLLGVVAASVFGFRPQRSPVQRWAAPRRRVVVAMSDAPGNIGPEQFTEKAWEALQGAGASCTSRSGGFVEPEDLLAAILKQDDNGLLNRALRLCDPPADVKVLERVVGEKLKTLPKVGGAGAAGATPQIGPRAGAVVTEAIKASKGFKDAYVSNEVLGLALHSPAACGALFA